MTYDPSNIYNQNDLNTLIEAKLINKDIVIRGEHLKTLSGFMKINGFLGLSDSSLESLGDLQEITGGFWISSDTVFPSLTSLGNLERVDGDVSLRYSNVTDLGRLKEVGGQLSLRDTPINNLGFLKFVGGDLFLPKRLQNKLDITNIIVKGKLRYWNDNNSKKTIKPKNELGLTLYKNGVPSWEHKYIYSIQDLNDANHEQKMFYKNYKQQFNNEIFLDLEGNDNYSFVLYFDLLKEYSSPKDIKTLQKYFNLLENHYPKTKNHTRQTTIEQIENSNDYESAWRLKQKEQYIGIETILKYEEKLHRSLLDGKLIAKLGGISHLTDFGQNNIEEIKTFADKQLRVYEKNNGAKFFELFLNHGKPLITNELKKKGFWNLFNSKKAQSQETYLYYTKFFTSEAEYNYYKAIDEKQTQTNYTSGFAHVVEKAILNQFRIILKQSEDLYRESIGMPKTGEGWISETELFYKISNSFPKYEVIHHSSPKWLGRQHLDIFIPEFNIGIEYQGAQHYEAIEFFGGQEGFEKTKERDEIKRNKCAVNNCKLIYVDEGYNFEDVKIKISAIIQQNIT
ncbi:MAG: hypothetical protein PF445_12565 [Melioribacteraceae bacterium]|jgi:hypothetical protein|nr:hypothetical protein [Melioribacteraceae bacterium]